MRLKGASSMQEEFLPILRSLKENIGELINPLDAAQLEFYGENSNKVQDSLDLIMGELTITVLWLTESDAEISSSELELINDMRHVVLGYGIPELTSNDYFDLLRQFRKLYPKNRVTVDNLPISILVLQNYDKKHNTEFANKVRRIFINFADAIVMADKNKNPSEYVGLEYFKGVLNAE